MEQTNNAERMIRRENILPVDMQLLADRKKLHEQRCSELRKGDAAPLLILSLNIPPALHGGTPAAFAMDCQLDNLEQHFGRPKRQQSYNDGTLGRCVYLLYDTDDRTIGEKAARLYSCLSPLFELQLITSAGKSAYLQRSAEPCRVCGGEAYLCERSHAHTAEEYEQAGFALLRDHAAGWVAKRGVTALCDQLVATPKPGLPDETKTGAGKISLAMLNESAPLLEPYLRACVSSGMDNDFSSLHLRSLAIDCEHSIEEKMGRVIHRGVIYLLGLLSVSLGRKMVNGRPFNENCAELADLLAAEMMSGSDLPPQENGSPAAPRVARRMLGLIGEVQSGMPLIYSAAESLIRQESTLTVYLTLLGRCEDTLLSAEHGTETLRVIQQRALTILNRPGFARKALSQVLDKYLIEKNARPGGAAVLLTGAFFLRYTSAIWQD